MSPIFDEMVAGIICFRNQRAWATFISWTQIVLYTIGLGLTGANLILVIQKEHRLDLEDTIRDDTNLPIPIPDSGFVKALTKYSKEAKTEVELMCIFTAGIVFGALLYTGIVQNKKIYFYLWKLFALGSSVYVMIFTVMNPTSFSNLFMILFVGLNCFACSIVSRVMGEIRMGMGRIKEYASKTGETDAEAEMEDADEDEDDVLLGGKKYSQFNDEYTLIPEGYIF